MVSIVVNLPDGSEVHLDMLYGDAIEILKAAKLLYPAWTSLVLTIAKVRSS